MDEHGIMPKHGEWRFPSSRDYDMIFHCACTECVFNMKVLQQCSSPSTVALNSNGVCQMKQIPPRKRDGD